MNHFLISYAGNKRNEYKEIKDLINLKGIKNIVEPFCGSSAISFNIWRDNKEANFNYFLNDNSSQLMKLYQLIKTENPEEIIKKVNEINKTINSKDDFLNLYKSNYDIYEFILLSKLSNFTRFGLFNINKKLNNDYKFSKIQLEFFNFIKSPNVFISNEDWIIPFDKHKNNSESLIFIDPPYLSLCNDFYQNKTINIYEYIFNNDLRDFKSRIYLILENMWIIKLLFKNYNILSKYDKQYQISKKKTQHLLIYNQD